MKPREAADKRWRHFRASERFRCEQALYDVEPWRVTGERALPKKLDVARALLLKGSVFLHLDPREEGTLVPPAFGDRPQLVLQVGLHMPVPIQDLRLDERGVSATLSFDRSPFACFVPWSSVFALVGDDGRGMVWPESMPVEIAAEVEREGDRRRAAKADAHARATRTRAVKARVSARARHEGDDEGSRPEGSRPVRSRKKPALAKSAMLSVAESAPEERKAPVLQVIHGQRERPSPNGAFERRVPHLRVVK